MIDNNIMKLLFLKLRKEPKQAKVDRELWFRKIVKHWVCFILSGLLSIFLCAWIEFLQPYLKTVMVIWIYSGGIFGLVVIAFQFYDMLTMDNTLEQSHNVNRDAMVEHYLGFCSFGKNHLEWAKFELLKRQKLHWFGIKLVLMVPFFLGVFSYFMGKGWGAFAVMHSLIQPLIVGVFIALGAVLFFSFLSFQKVADYIRTLEGALLLVENEKMRVRKSQTKLTNNL